MRAPVIDHTRLNLACEPVSKWEITNHIYELRRPMIYQDHLKMMSKSIQSLINML